MVIPGFNFSGFPGIIYGAGAFIDLPLHISKFGKRALLVTGASSLAKTGNLERLISQLAGQSISCRHIVVEKEPSPELVDKAVEAFRRERIDVVIAVGGGSVIDAAKAVSAMLPSGEPVYDYLEGVGSGRVHDGRKIPLIAVPTTSGTGSEATKNAVLSRVGPNGFKKSLRHDNFISNIAIIDPGLTLSCPRDITASTGLDAFTQLLGSYVSTAASPVTDALAFKGLELIKDSLIPLCSGDPRNAGLRGAMALAAFFSGITLANAGLDIVHGLASPIGGYFDIPHGIVCGSIAGEAIRVNVESLIAEGNFNALKKYARVGSLFSGNDEAEVERGCMELITIIDEWVDILEIPRLGKFGITETDLDKIAAGAGNKNNPVKLGIEEIKTIVRNRL